MTANEHIFEQVQSGRRVMIRVSLGDHWRKLQLIELQKPDPGYRREVPTIEEMAEAAGVSRQSMSNLLHNKYKAINLEAVAAAATLLNERGFPTGLEDVFTLYTIASTESEP